MEPHLIRLHISLILNVSAMLHSFLNNPVSLIVDLWVSA